MQIKIKKSNSINNQTSIAVLIDAKNKINSISLNSKELAYIKKNEANLFSPILINHYDRQIFVIAVKTDEKNGNTYYEKIRKAGNELSKQLKALNIDKIQLTEELDNGQALISLAEGLCLGSYTFTKYKSKKPEKSHPLKSVDLISKNIKPADAEELENNCTSVFITRNLVNEPVATLTAVKLSEEIKKLGSKSGFKVEVLNKTKIAALKMGGLLAVNYGSPNPPTFTILEYKHPKAKNKKPVVFVGKGVVFDTGGVNIKTAGMETMKCDMAGAAAVVGAINAIATNKLPVHIIGLIPATDNRPGGNAYVPGDVITMMDGTTVEVLNTDAEGRMILADALVYAQKYKPELVIDLATLTGAAIRALGNSAIAAMGNADEGVFNALKKSSFNVHERIAELPFWEDYAEMIKSDIADIKNIGGPLAGAITAGKFLEHFTNYPWIHLDIAGPAFNEGSADSYRGKGATGIGVRLLYDFIKNKYLNYSD
ncbi:MAG: leucyl aminopeptidase family protein [Bacteroidia bacterium]